MFIEKKNETFLAKVREELEADGFEVDMFTQPNINPHRDFGKVGRIHCEIKKEHYLFEGFRGSDYVSKTVVVWSWYQLNNRYMTVGLLKQEVEVRTVV